MGLGAAERGDPKLVGKGAAASRAAAADQRALLARGLDPIDEREKTKEVARQAEADGKVQKARERLTLCCAARSYHERVIEPKRSRRHAESWIASLEKHVPASVWNAPIASIDAPMLLDALLTVESLEKPGEHIPETLKRIRQRLDAVFGDAVFYKHCTTNPAAAIRRKLQEQRQKPRATALRALPYAEAPSFLQRLRAVDGIAARCLELAMLTAARTGEDRKSVV